LPLAFAAELLAVRWLDVEVVASEWMPTPAFIPAEIEGIVAGLAQVGVVRRVGRVGIAFRRPEAGGAINLPS